MQKENYSTSVNKLLNDVAHLIATYQQYKDGRSVERLRALGWTQKQIGELLGYHRSVMARLYPLLKKDEKKEDK
jgi:ParB-like chromosome segregation protein Spo0J